MRETELPAAAGACQPQGAADGGQEARWRYAITFCLTRAPVFNENARFHGKPGP